MCHEEETHRVNRGGERPPFFIILGCVEEISPGIVRMGVDDYHSMVIATARPIAVSVGGKVMLHGKQRTF